MWYRVRKTFHIKVGLSPYNMNLQLHGISVAVKLCNRCKITVAPLMIAMDCLEHNI